MSEPVNVKLLDREFLVACEPDEREGLVAAAQHLDARMRELRSAARTPGFDRLAVLAALSITHELLDRRRHDGERERTLSAGLGHLRRRLEDALASGEESRL